MARSFPAFALTSLLSAGFVFSTGLALAQPGPEPSASPGMSPSPRDGGGKHPKKDRDLMDDEHRPPLPPLDQDNPMSRFKKKLEQMSPEERQRFQDNWKRWKDMNDGERKDWQKRAMEERDRLNKNIDDAIAKLGLKLDSDQREVFALRYHQERRKLEQQICEEMDKKREAGLEAMLQQLKAEFSVPKPVPSATPAATQ